MFLPTIAYAQDNVETLIGKISFFILNPVLAVLFGAALIVFIWGVVEYLMNPDSEDARTRGVRHVLWGLVGMLVMFSAFALLNLIGNTVGSDVEIPSPNF